VVAGPLGAQVVRGVVRDARTQAPIPGVIVSLDVAPGGATIGDSTQRASLVYAVLTNDRGEFSVQSQRAGRWVISAKMVGMRRWVSPPFELNVGENARRDIVLEAIDFTASLPTVSVTTDAPCSINPRESQRVAVMWEEARAALTAAQLSVRDRLFRATVVRYQRRLSPNMRVLRDDKSVRRGVTERAFVSVSPESLSAEGYVQRDAEGGLTFNAPDAEVLTSTAFVRDHCFSLARPRRERPGLIGLAFQPVRSREQSGIQGAIWLDSTNYALRIVDFGYTRLPEYIDPAHARGEVQFGHLDNGAWYVSRWYIRMPEYRVETPNSRVLIAASPVIDEFREEGGDVTIDGTASHVRSARVVGRATDSTGRAMRNAVVRLKGTPHTSPVAADGSFSIDSLAAGSYTLELEHRDYASLGMLAAEQDLEVGEGRDVSTAVRALSSEQVLRRLCGVGGFEGDVGAVRVRVRDTNNAPVPGVAVRARFNRFEIPTGGVGPAAVRPITESTQADSSGVAMFCSLPARQQVRFEYTPAGLNHVIHQVFTLTRHSIASIILRP
jgi:hypothetical protein